MTQTEADIYVNRKTKTLTNKQRVTRKVKDEHHIQANRHRREYTKYWHTVIDSE